MKRLTETQKTAIRDYRGSGLGYKAIAGRLNLSRETIRSFCMRNDVSVGRATGTEADRTNALSIYWQRFHRMFESGGRTNQDAGRTTGNTSEYKIGNTVFVISTGYSENASETLEKKLEKLILDDAARQSRSC